MKFVIINADDYGLCESVNRAIIECLDSGIVSDLSFIIHQDTFETSHKILAVLGKKDVGLHLNFTVGKSFTNKGSSLFDSGNRYLDLKAFMSRILLKRVNKSDIYTEIKAQIGLLIDYGYTITHIDSHMNVHLLPLIFIPLLKINKELGLNVPIRMPMEDIKGIFNLKISNLIRINILNMLTWYCSQRSKYIWNVRVAGGNFFNNAQPHMAFKKMLQSIRKSPYTVFEMAVHPGYFSEILRQYDSYCHQRLVERDFLMNKDIIKSNNDVKIVNFSTPSLTRISGNQFSSHCGSI